MKKMTSLFKKLSIENKALYLELIRYIEGKYDVCLQEVMLKDILPTDRRFRADIWVPAGRFTVEVNGGSWTGGRHVRGLGYENDLIKINLLQTNNIRCFQYTFDMLKKRLYLNNF